ncbi:MAG: hypothetical protein M1819_005466 [Sarea resinae]|nr:MAG: hypothetical protein M1819_005466 [Sarea resinae]
MSEPIAVIGMGCRLPGGVASPQQLWDLLSNGRDAGGPVPPDRWNADAFYNPDQEAKESINSKNFYFLSEDIRAFDARFFEVRSYEAHTMDPQQRIILETTYEALENAGLRLEDLEGSDTSVFVAVYGRDYDRMGYKDVPLLTKGHTTGAGEAVLSNRISYLLDLKGASMTIDTGCSGSMVALHQACLTLKSGASRIAVVGGTELLLHPDQTIAMSQVGMINPDGKCYVFDSRGSGYARGEGVGTVVIKLLKHAIEDGDPIHAVIQNTALNQDGRTAGISLPNSEAQSDVIESVYTSAGLDPNDTLYVEAHGTGTQAGDKAEFASISKVFCEQRNRESDLYVGSVKANIGHLEAASGVAGLIKGILVLKKGLIPPHAGLITPKPSLLSEGSKIKIARGLTPLAPLGYSGPRRVSVNSFGYGGTNCHVILDAAPDAQQTPGVVPRTATLSNGNGIGISSAYDGHVLNGDRTTTNGYDAESLVDGNRVNDHTNGQAGAHIRASKGESEQASPGLFVLSAASEAAIKATAANLHEWLASPDGRHVDLKDLSLTLGLRRSQLTWRAGVVASTHEELSAALDDLQPRKTPSSPPASLTFVFTGQGAQWYAMGRELVTRSHRFRDSILRSDEVMRALGCNWSLEAELAKPKEESRINQAELAQPSTTAIQIALVDLLAELSVVPNKVMGHSSGEIAAAYAAGALDQGAAMEISYRRGLSSALAHKANPTRGAMMAVGASEAAITPLVKSTTSGKARVACVNSPGSVTLSGDESAINEIMEKLQSEGTFHRKLQVEVAYHSHHMEKIAHDYLLSLSKIKTTSTRPEVRFYSSVTGKLKTNDFGAAYWTANLTSQVRFSQALQLLARDTSASRGSLHLYVEIGPHAALGGPIRQTLGSIESHEYLYQSPLLRNKDAALTFFRCGSSLWELSYPLQVRPLLDLEGSAGRTFHVVDNLPPYPWDHGTCYWHESRLSREHRLRQFPYHDLLGVFDPMSTVFEPRWRYHLNLRALPWLKHHVVDDTVVFPGTGYMCMAIEGLKQLIQMRGNTAPIGKFVLRDIVFSRALEIPNEREDGLVEEVEVQLILSPSKTTQNGSWDMFKVMSLADDGSWAENCTGLISAEPVPASVDEVEGHREAQLASAAEMDRLQRIRETSLESVSSEGFYSTLRSSGNNFGPTFATLNNIAAGPCQGYGGLTIPDVASYMPKPHLQPHVIHPSTFDALNHLSILIFKRECSNAPLMLTFIKEVVVSTDMTTQAGGQLMVALEATPDDKRSLTANSWTYQPGKNGDLVRVLTLNGLQLRAVGDEAPKEGEKVFPRPMNYQLDWKPDVDFMALHHSSAPLINQARKAHDDEVNDVVAAIYIRRALKTVGDKSPVTNLAKMFTWMKSYATTEQFEELLTGTQSGDDEEAVLCRSGQGTDIEAVALSVIGPHLAGLLTGEADMPGLLTDDALLISYQDGLSDVPRERLIDYIQLLAHKLPFMRILEINAGQYGATAARLLKALSRPSGMLLNQYQYTDPSAESVDIAKKSLKDWESSVVFKTLDIHKDPKEQGFDEGTYDLVIAPDGLFHTTTASLVESLSHIRKLVRPGGRMVLAEPRRPTAAQNIVFGTRASWWETADNDANEHNHILPSSEHWNDSFQQAFFTGLEDIPSFPGILVCKANESSNENGVADKSPHVQFVTNPSAQTATTSSLFKKLEDLFGTNEIQLSSTTLEAVEPKEDIVYIVLDSANSPILAEPSVESFAAIQRLLCTSRHAFWVTFQEDDSTVAAAYKGLICGLARVVRRENDGVRLITLDVQGPVADNDGNVADALFEVARRIFWPRSPEERYEEFELTYDVLDGGGVLIPRVFANSQFNHWVDRVNGEDILQTQPYHQLQRPLKLEVGSPGLLHSLRFADDETPSLPLGPDEIQLKARAYGVNFRDVFIALGQMPPGLPMVGEVAGVVSAVGSNMADRYRVGDKVMATGAEPFASQARVDGYCAHVIPQSLNGDFAKAASIPLVFLTAYHGLVNVARLTPGQTVLIHAASGGVGQAAIQIAQHLGAEIFTTVSSNEKKKLIVDRYALPESHIFSSRGSTFTEGIMRLTKNRGVDCILNSIAGETLNESWKCIAPLGTFVEIGKADMYKRNYLSMVPFDRSTTFAAVDMSMLLDTRPQMIQDMLEKLCQMMDSGVTSPVLPLMPMGMDKIEASFRLIATRKHTGKVILEADDETVVKAVMTPMTPLRLNPKGAYIIAGGLGDLGKKFCRLLAHHGAGHIITFSRRNLDPAFRKAFESEIEEFGSRLHILKCDITNRSSVEEAAQYCRDNSLQVKGIINGGAVLRDRPFESMEHDDWNISLGPKVKGTINLHSAFESAEPDFFITLSSISAILGKTGQSNYAAGNAFMDAFALAHKGKSRTHFISLNLGAIEGSELVSTVPNGQQELLAKMGALMMNFDELYKVLEYAMSPQAVEDSCFQSIMGFDRKSMMAIGDEFALSNPFFSMVPYLSDDHGGSPAGPSKHKVDVSQNLAAAASLDEAEEIVLGAITERFALFMDRSVEDIALDKPISAFGLDSLVAIELKNYMTRTFQIAIQTSEISDALGMAFLARVIATRSKLVRDEVRSSGSSGPSAEKSTLGSKEEAPEPATTATTATIPERKTVTPDHGYACCRYSKDLPRQPGPGFEEALGQFLTTIGLFAKTQEELEGLKAAIHHFSAEGSLARELYAQLRNDAHDPSCENWATDRITEGRWLKQRNSMLIDTIFLSTHRQGTEPQSQASRAALICATSFRFKQAIESNAVEPYFWFGVPACASQWDWLFNVLHEARPSVDKIEKFSGDYCVALSRGHVFKIALQGSSQEDLQSVFETIIDRTREQKPSLAGILTADNRDSWAEIKKTLRTKNAQNEAYFRTIDEAAFVICLDDEEAKTNEDQVRQALWGGGFNRWLDKTLQFTVSADGKSACLVDHSKIDGLAPHRLNEWIQERINEKSQVKKLTNGATNGHSYNMPPLEEYSLSTTREVEDHIVTVQQHCFKELAHRTYNYVHLPRFGKSFLAAHSTPIKGVLRLTMQLAARLFFGWSPPSVEPFSLTHFHKGRAERFQTTTPAVTQFCDAMVFRDDDDDDDDSNNTSKRWELLMRAVAEISDEGHKAAGGHYFDPLMVILESYMWPAEQPLPALFRDPVYQRTKEMLLQTDMIGDEAKDAARITSNPNAFWIRYTLWDEE